MENKYSRLQINIHWLVLLLVIVAYCAMKFRGFFLRSDRPLIDVTRISCGVSILMLVVVRLLLRLRYPTPPITPKPKPIMAGLAHLGHLVIYLPFIALPAIGLVMMCSRGDPWFAFGLTIPCASEANLKRVDNLKSWHETLTNLEYSVIELRAAATLAHHHFWKDNTLLRIVSRKRSWRIFKRNAYTKTDPWYRRRIRIYIGSTYYIYLYGE